MHGVLCHRAHSLHHCPPEPSPRWSASHGYQAVLRSVKRKLRSKELRGSSALDGLQHQLPVAAFQRHPASSQLLLVQRSLVPVGACEKVKNGTRWCVQAPASAMPPGAPPCHRPPAPTWGMAIAHANKCRRQTLQGKGQQCGKLTSCSAIPCSGRRDPRRGCPPCTVATPGVRNVFLVNVGNRHSCGALALARLQALCTRNGRTPMLTWLGMVPGTDSPRLNVGEDALADSWVATIAGCSHEKGPSHDVAR
jgi:hypothetical protein